MNKNEILKQTIEYVKKELGDESTGHDFWHSILVMRNAERIAKKEGADVFICKMGAILHDIGDWKFHGAKGKNQIEKYLSKTSLSEKEKNKILTIIKEIDYKGDSLLVKLTSKEAEVLYDADKLEALGAIGVARAFATGQKFNQQIHNPEFKPRIGLSPEEYGKQYTGERKNTTINHFYEKLLFLKDNFKTKTGKKIAKDRNKYMESFLKRFYAEWEGKK